MSKTERRAEHLIRGIAVVGIPLMFILMVVLLVVVLRIGSQQVELDEARTRATTEAVEDLKSMQRTILQETRGQKFDRDLIFERVEETHARVEVLCIEHGGCEEE